MITVFSVDSEFKSAKRLGFNTVRRVGYTDDYDNDIVIRWGTGFGIDSRNRDSYEFKNVVNEYKNIRLNVHKHEALKAMSKVVRTIKLIEGKVPAGVKAVVRPLNHSGGAGFKIVTGPYHLNSDEEYATELLDTKNEYRVWFIGDKTRWAQRVALKNNNPNEVCRSHWGYRYMEEAVPTKLIKQVLKAAKVIGLELGAADVLEKDGKFYICELNTAYSVDTPLLTKWSRKNILEYVQKKFPTFDLSRETQQTVE